MEEPLLAHPSYLQMIYLLRDRVQNGVLPSWIHEADVYKSNPADLTAQKTAVTASDGLTRWYFCCTPKAKTDEDARLQRKTGSGTWKGERGFFITEGSDHKRVGRRHSFSFVKTVKVDGQKKNVGQGWIMVEFSLLDGTKMVLYKMYRSPNKNISDGPTPPPSGLASEEEAVTQSGLAAALTAAITAPAAVPDEAASTTASAATVLPEAAAAEEEAVTQSGLAAALTAAITAPAAAVPEAAEVPEAATASAATTTASAATVLPEAAAAAEEEAVTQSGLAAALTAAITAPAVPEAAEAPEAATDKAATTTASAATVLPEAAAITSTFVPATPATHKATARNTSPRKKWVRVQVSGSPTKSTDGSSAKRVYQMILPEEEEEEEEGATAHPAKRARVMRCSGWLNIELLQEVS